MRPLGLSTRRCHRAHSRRNRCCLQLRCAIPNVAAAVVGWCLLAAIDVGGEVVSAYSFESSSSSRRGAFAPTGAGRLMNFRGMNTARVAIGGGDDPRRSAFLYRLHHRRPRRRTTATTTALPSFSVGRENEYPTRGGGAPRLTTGPSSKAIPGRRKNASEASRTDASPSPTSSASSDAPPSSTASSAAPPPLPTADAAPPPQNRIKPKRKTKPPYYWSELDNVHTELLGFWDSIQVPIAPDELSSPPIPNDALLEHFRRFDLKYGIVANGGREGVSRKLGGCRVVPGRWSEAVNTPEVRHLLAGSKGRGLSAKVPPVAPHVRKAREKWKRRRRQQLATKRHGGGECDGRGGGGGVDGVGGGGEDVEGERRRWGHQEGRKPWGYWDEELVISELNDFLEKYGKERNHPSIWMPRMTELLTHGREDLHAAIIRFGGIDDVCRSAGLVPYLEWQHFESLYKLVVELRSYLDEYHGGEVGVFPPAHEIMERGNKKLYSLVQRHGGRKYVARRFGMQFSKGGANARSGGGSGVDLLQDLNWGPFSLDFAREVLSFVRARMMRQRPPTRAYLALKMPSSGELVHYGERGRALMERIERYGGYENVARRLGLALFDDDGDDLRWASMVTKDHD